MKDPRYAQLARLQAGNDLHGTEAAVAERDVDRLHRNVGIADRTRVRDLATLRAIGRDDVRIRRRTRDGPRHARR